MKYCPVNSRRYQLFVVFSVFVFILSYPEALFASVVVSTGIADSNTNYGSLQRKLVRAGSGTVAYDNSNSVYQSAVSSTTLSLTVGTGSNRALVVSIGFRGAYGPARITSVTYAGTNLTFIGRQAADVDVGGELWGMVAPATGANNVVVNYVDGTSASDNFVVGAISFTGVDQINPFGSFQGTFVSAGTTISVSVPSNTGDMVVDSIAKPAPAGCGDNITTTGGQTKRLDICSTASERGGSSTLAGSAGNVTMSWSATSEKLVLVAVNLQAASSTTNLYAFYNTSTDSVYKKSTDNGSTWGSAVIMDGTDANDINPSTYVMDNYIYSAWLDTTKNVIEVNRVNAASSDTKGTQCTSGSLIGSLSATYEVSIAVTSDGTIYLAYSDTSSGPLFGVLKLVYSGCTFTSITSGASAPTTYYLSQAQGADISPTYGSWDVTTSGERLKVYFSKQNTMEQRIAYSDASTANQNILFRQYVSQPIAAQTISAQSVRLSMRGDESALTNNLFMAWVATVVSNDGTTTTGTLRSLGRDGTEYATAITNRSDVVTSTAVTANAGDRLVIEVGYGGTPVGSHTGDLGVGDNNATDLPNDDTTTAPNNPVLVFTNTMSLLGSGLTAGDRPVLVNVGNSIHLIYQDGNLSDSIWDGTTWITSNTTVASVTDNNYSVTTDGTNLWALSVSGTTATNLYKYNGTAWSTLTAPWTGQTNLTGASISYDIANSKLYAFVLHDASSQVYQESTSASTISWSSERSLALTAGTLTNLSSNMWGLQGSSDMGVVMRQGSNFEYADSGPPTQVVFTNSPISTTAATCSTLTIVLEDASGNTKTPTSSTTIQLSSGSSGGTFSIASNCSGATSTLDLAYATTDTTKTAYYVDTKKSNPIWTLTSTKTVGSDTITSGTQNATITAGSVAKLAVTLPDQIFTDSVGNSGSVVGQSIGTPFLINLTATDSYNNINTTYTGDKVLVFSGPAVGEQAPTVKDKNGTSIAFGSNNTTTFTGGVAVGLVTTLYKAESTTITVTDAGSYGVASSTLAVGTPKVKLKGGTSIKGGFKIN